MDERGGKEFVAKKKWDVWQVALFLGVIACMIALAAILHNVWWMVGFLFVLVILSLYYMKNTFKAEYAYTFTNKFIVEILKSGGKRKALFECFLSNVKKCGKYNKENKDTLGQVDEVIKAATDVKDEEGTYFLLVEKDSKKTLLLFTPEEMMLDELKKRIECNIN